MRKLRNRRSVGSDLADGTRPGDRRTRRGAARIAEPGAQHGTSRFEGYLYLDIEGQPLPIQSDAEIEAFLAEAEIVETQPVPTGITLPRRLMLKGDGFEA